MSIVCSAFYNQVDVDTVMIEILVSWQNYGVSIISGYWIILNFGVAVIIP